VFNQNEQQQIQSRFEGYDGFCQTSFFTQKLAGACQYRTETEQLLKEVTGLSEKLELQIFNFIIDKDQMASYSIDKIPVTVIESVKDYGIRF